MSTPEQLMADQKANVATLFDLTSKAFEGLEKLVALNLQVAKTSMEEASGAAKAALSVKGAQELMALQQGLLQPAAEKAAAYSRHLYDIATGLNAEVTKVTEGQLADAQKKMTAAMETALSNSPLEAGGASALMKSALSAANNAYDTVQKAAKQAASVAEANAQAFAASVTPAATKGKRG